MIRTAEIWKLIRRNMPRGIWISLDEIYRIVERNGSLDGEDLMPDAPGSAGLRWKRNVRNVLQMRKSLGEIEWNGYAKYRMN